MSITDISSIEIKRVIKIIRGYLKILVLQSIEEEEKTSYAIKEHIGSIWDKKPSSGSLFPVIKKLTNEKLIKSNTIENKKIFHIRKKGTELLNKLVNEKENDLIDHILLLKSIKQLNNNREVKIIEKLSERMQEPKKSNLKLLSKTTNETQKTIRKIIANQLTKKQEKEFTTINDEFLKRIKEFNKKLRQ